MQTIIELPPPVEMTMPFSQVLGRRRSRREFSDQPLDLPLLSTLLWACAGKTAPMVAAPYLRLSTAVKSNVSFSIKKVFGPIAPRHTR